jgi:crotonobetainyl-CoA:carnitine CoA-transferase CaiB-like acyl-CoA transferase
VTLIETDPARRPRSRTGPLAGVRVTDFCWMGVGSCATRVLADFGAEVIRIEDRNRLDMPRRLPVYKNEPAKAYGQEEVEPDPNKGGIFNNYNRNKLAITLNMRAERGRELAMRLISISSVLTENFAPGVMERWGLGTAEVEARWPELIYARMSGFGQTGPHSQYRSYGPIVQAVSGLTFISGLPGAEPSGWGLSYMDNQAALYNAAAIIAAIFARTRGGSGTSIDVSAVEAGIQLIGPTLLDSRLGKPTAARPDFPYGNRLEHSDAAPHGVYPCRGADCWIAITVFDQQQWGALLEVMGHPHWADDTRFATQPQRHAHQDELDSALTQWTREHNRHELMHRLQRAGVPAAAVQDAEDVSEHDPQFAWRDAFFELDHPVIGEARFEGVPFTSTGYRADHWRSGPLLGEDNMHVFGTLLGLDADEIAELTRDGVIQ